MRMARRYMGCRFIPLDPVADVSVPDPAAWIERNAAQFHQNNLSQLKEKLSAGTDVPETELPQRVMGFRVVYPDLPGATSRDVVSLRWRWVGART